MPPPRLISFFGPPRDSKHEYHKNAILAAVHNGDNRAAAIHHTSIALIHRGIASEHTNDKRHTAAAASHSKSAVSHTNAAKSYALAGDTARAELSRKAAAASRAAAAASHAAAALEHANNQRHAAAAAGQEAAARSSTLAGDHKAAEASHKAAEASHRAAAAAAKHEDEKHRLLAMAEASKHKAEAAASTALGNHAEAATSLQHAGDALHAADRTRDAANTYYHAAISSTAAANAHADEELARKSRDHAAELHAKSAETHSSIKNFKFAEANQRMAQALHTRNGNATAATISLGLANAAKSQVHAIAIPHAQSARTATPTRAPAVTRNAGSANAKGLPPPAAVADPKHAVPPHAGSVVPVQPNVSPHAGSDHPAPHEVELVRTRKQAAAGQHKADAEGYALEKNHKEAAKSFALAAAAHAAIGEHEHEAASRSLAAEHHDLAGEHDHAADHHEAAAAFLSKNNRHADASESHAKAAASRRKMVEVHKGNKDAQKADRSMKLAEASDHKALAAQAVHDGNHSEAAGHFSNAAAALTDAGEHDHAAAAHTDAHAQHVLAKDDEKAAESLAKAAVIRSATDQHHVDAAAKPAVGGLSGLFRRNRSASNVVQDPYTPDPQQISAPQGVMPYSMSDPQIAPPQHGMVPYSNQYQQQIAPPRDVSYDPGQSAGPMPSPASTQPLGSDLVQNILDVKNKISGFSGLDGVAPALDVILLHRDLINPDERLRNAIAALQSVKLAVQEKLRRGSPASTGADDALYLEVIDVLNSLLMAVSRRGIQMNEELAQLEDSIGQLKAEADAP